MPKKETKSNFLFTQFARPINYQFFSKAPKRSSLADECTFVFLPLEPIFCTMRALTNDCALIAILILFQFS